MADNNDLFNERKRIISEIKQLQRDIQASASDSEDLEKRKNKLAKELLETNKQIRESQLEINAEQFQATKSLSSLYTNLTNLEKERIRVADSRMLLDDEHLITIGRIAELNRELAQLSEEDDLQKRLINKQIDEQMKSLAEVSMENESQRDSINEMLANLSKQNELAKDYSSQTQYQKELLEAKLQVYDGIKKSIAGVLDTASLMFSNLKAGIGLSTIAAGKFVGKLGEVRSQLGGLAEFGTTALSFFDDNAVDNAKELAAQFGGMNNVSGELQASVSLISTNMGIAGTEAASLIGSFARLNGGSSETALNLTKATQQFAKQNGVIPSDVMKDLADASQEFALYGKEGGKNLIEAATYARKLGTNLKTITAISDSLLDFETSITKELEASVILGRNINLNEARGLYFAGEKEKATKSVLRELGGIDAFNKMDVFQKRAVADLLDIQVDTLETMLVNQENANELAGTLAGKFSVAGEALQTGLNKYLGVTVEGLGGALIAIGQMGTGLSTLASPFQKAAGWAGKLFEKFKGGATIVEDVSTKAKDALLNEGVDKASDELTKKVLAGGDDLSKVEQTSKTASAMNPATILSAAAAMLAFAGAIWILAKAVQEFAKIDIEKMGYSLGFLAVAMAGLIGMLFALGTMTAPLQPLLLPLVGILLAFGAAVTLIGLGVNLATTGLAKLVESFSLLDSTAAANMLAFGASILMLAGALQFLALAGILAIPTLLALNALGVELGFFGKNTDTDSNSQKVEDSSVSQYHTDMLTKMDQLIEAVRAPANVILDGNKVGELIRPKIERANGNITGIKSR